MIEVFINGSQLGLKTFKFPAGETSIQVDEWYSFTRTTIAKATFAMVELKFESNDDLINLLLVMDALRREYTSVEKYYLKISYFPYARQDRVCNKGEALSVKVIADLINSLKFDTVYVDDPHSDVLGAVLNNIKVSNIYDILRNLDNAFPTSKNWRNSILVSPDAGANKKVFNVAKYFNVDTVVRADKTRDTKTGKITGTVVYSEHVGDRDFLILDDIADGAGSFIPLADELRKLTTGNIYLYVTHGLFTKGYEILEGKFDKIFVHNLMNVDNPLIRKV